MQHFRDFFLQQDLHSGKSEDELSFVNLLKWFVFDDALRPLIVNYMFLIHCPHCYSSPSKFDHYYDVMPFLDHICNIVMQAIQSVFSKLMKIVI